MSRRTFRHKSAESRCNVRLQVEYLESRTLLTVTLSEAFTLAGDIPASPIGAANYLQPTAYVPFTIDHDALADQLEGAPRRIHSGGRSSRATESPRTGRLRPIL